MASGTILHKLQLLMDEGVFSVEEDRFNELKGELKEASDFIHHARGSEDSFKGLVDFVRRKRERLYSSFELDQASSGDDSIAAASIFGDFLKNFRQQTRSLDDFVYQSWPGFYSLLLKDGLPSTVADRESLENFGQQIRDFYKGMRDSMVQLFWESRTRYLQQRWEHDLTGGWEEMCHESDGFSYLLTFFQQHVESILRLGERCDSRFAAVLEPVLMDPTIPEAVSKRVPMNRTKPKEFRDDRRRRLESIKRSPVVVPFIARLCCWFLRDGVHLNTSESVEQINPDADQASLAYTSVWKSGSRSLTLSTEAMTCIDSIIGFCKDDHGLKELKVELSLVKTFFLCARKLCDSSTRTEILEDSVSQNWQQFCSFLLQLEHGLPPSEWAGAISNLRRILKSYRKKFNELYVEMSGNCFWESSSGSRDEFMEFIYSLLENLEDIVIWVEACDSRLAKWLELLQEKLVFLKNFILFASLQGKPERKLMEHCGVVAISAAHLPYICWFFRFDNQELDCMDSKISELTDKIMHVDHRLTYIGVLESGTTSPTLSTETDVIIVGEFVDSLLGHLGESLLNCPTCFMVSLKHQLRMLFEGLQFLRNILNKEKYDGIEGKIKDLIGAVVNDAGIVIFSLPQDEALAKEIDIKLFCLLGKINTIKAAVDESYRVVPRFDCPTTNVLGIVDDLLDKLKELASYKVDPLSSFAKDRSDFLRSYIEKNVEDLSFLRSFLENNLEQHKQNEGLQLQEMQDGLVSLRSFLERNREHPNYDEGLEALWSHIVKVAYKAEFVIDSLIVGDVSFYSLLLLDNVREEIVNCAQKATEMSKASSKWTTEALYQVPSEGGISTNNKAVVELKDEAQAKIVGMPDTVRSETSGASHQVSSSDGISTVDEAEVALQDEEDKIIDLLIKGPTQRTIISIVGVAGLGKTFLAQRVYRDPRVTFHFHIQAWCCVSQTHYKRDLLLQILACIGQKTQFSEKDENDLALALYQRLLEQRFLIVLDDIWDIEAWNALEFSFPKKNNGSRILLTSRHTDVIGPPIGTPYHLRTLDESESRALLEKKLAVIREGGYPQELGWKIAKNCNGLPLSIAIISGILATLDQAGWEEVAEKISLTAIVGATEQCSRILELSYGHLPDYLKRCILYFGAFREDQEICVRRLTWLWMAEGFVQKSESECLEKIAEGYVMALINRSLVMVGQRRCAGEVKTCRIHDLLHVFCERKAKNQNFLQLVRGYDEGLTFDEPYNPRRLSIQAQPKHFIKSRIIYPQIRSLLYSSRDFGVRQLGCNFPLIFLLKLLRVLDLENICLGSAFPRELWSLVQLRYLAVLGWLKNGIPSSLEKLSNLETFLVRTKDDVGLSLLQDTLLKMQKLRHLHVYGALIDIGLANDNLETSSILNNLDTFSTVKLYLGQSMEKMIRKFPNIRRLKCCLLQSGKSSCEGTRIVAMDFLSQLESLKLLLGKVTALPIEYHLPSNLKKLTLEDFSWSIMSTIRNLPNLEALKLLRPADGVREWDMEGMEEEEFFPALKFLKLKDLSIVRWMGSEDHFPSLERLIMEGCAELEELPSCLQESLTLQFIEVRGCLFSAGESVREIKQHQIKYGNPGPKILISEEIEESDGDSDGWGG